MKTAYIIGIVVGVVLLVGIAIALMAQAPTPSPTPSPATKPEERVVEITITGGEVDATYAFSLGDGQLTSPGPTIRVKVGDTVRLTFTNKGAVPHAFWVVEEAKEGATEALFGAELGSPTDPVMPGETLTITFKPDRAGEFAYICPIPGHVTLGMYGKLIVEP